MYRHSQLFFLLFFESERERVGGVKTDMLILNAIISALALLLYVITSSLVLCFVLSLSGITKYILVSIFICISSKSEMLLTVMYSKLFIKKYN